MKDLNKTSGILLVVALILTVCFPAGVVGIVVGASKGVKILLVCGIIGTVVGFYVMPVVWIKFAETKGLKTVLSAIENDNIYEVKTLAQQLNSDNESIAQQINILIQKRYLRGYLFVDKEHLELNNNKKQVKNSVVKCSNCGGEISAESEVCDYCGRRIK